MESKSATDPFVSVIITVRNEGPHLRELLESLLVQAPPFEVVLVDALSRDSSYEIAREYARRHPDLLRVVQQACSRGGGRNLGVEIARGGFVAFIDGDCRADPKWIAALRERLRTSSIVAGRTALSEPSRFGELERVELFEEGSDVTYPSCNLAYERSLFRRVGGFDSRFVTAEDIDLNLRAVRLGSALVYAPEAVVFHHARATLPQFLVQAFWNGYGRKQLTEKHGSLWGSYRLGRLAARQRGWVATARLGAALLGYFARVVSGIADRLDRPAGDGSGGVA